MLSCLQVVLCITWGSKLQTETVLSTTESEYIALSTACRRLEISLVYYIVKKPEFKCKVWEC